MLRPSRSTLRRLHLLLHRPSTTIPIVVDTTCGRLRGHSTSSKEKSNDSRTDPNSLQSDQAMKITRVGMYVNLAMAACKGTVGCAVNSSALVADAAHSLSDLLSDIVTLWAVRISRLPPDDEHPYGYGKFEAVGSLTVGAILTAAGVGMGYDAFHILQTGFFDAATATTVAVPSFLDLSFLTSLDRTTQWGIAAGAAIVSIGAKEALYHATVRIGNQTNSKVLIANAWHHRTDAISSVVALGGIVGSMANIPLFDPIAGAVVSCMIAKTGVDICLDSVRELTDKSVEDEVLDLLRHSSSSVEDVVSVSNVRARRMGPYTLVDLRVNVHGRTSVSAAQQLAARVKAEVLRRVPDVSEVLVHIDVANEHDHDDGSSSNSAEQMRPFREIKHDVLHAIKAIPEILSVTHVNVHWVVHRDRPSELGTAYGTDLDVTIVVHPDMAVRDVHNIARRARREIERLSYVVTADIHLELYDEETMVLDERPPDRASSPTWPSQVDHVTRDANP
ncbi:hypothetical protein H257_06015 [Aphanomyces astaci]|uniref:Uncharacterized protein n=1 Tax=Aphanomyces astaci TaxID=112090 RepID=W4GR85_APHAT|nr:hypothetical protein H257_06015 [Aphanomyces astaci]ETV81519.1 hypothetical protein H257_06015 [Aphanomyces astaci]|eukprot:XP_009829377.1 hypothetical protein H257_06015 [Aphanomyces astaci]